MRLGHLQLVAARILKPLTDVINKWFSKGYFPSPFKTARVTPTLTKGDPNYANNYSCIYSTATS
jgi:hypothetical protein